MLFRSVSLDESMTTEIALVDDMLLRTSQLETSISNLTNQSTLTDVPTNTAAALGQILLTMVDLS